MDIQDASLRRRLKRIRVLVLDVDGVLTDGGMYYGPTGDAFKKFNTKDGMGLARLREHNVSLALITGEDTEIVFRRAEKLQIHADNVFVGVKDKAAVLQEFLSKNNLVPEESAYMGDDVNDLEAMKLVSVAFAPADAVDPVRKAAHIVTERRGGDGAVREVCELILKHLD